MEQGPNQNPACLMPNKPFHIVLVEDDEFHAELVEEAFASHQPQHKLTVANSIAQTRELLSNVDADLLLVDLVLPDGRGTDLLPGDDQQAGMPIILLTSHGDEQVAVESIKSGALDYIVKSARIFEEMPRIVESAIRQWGHVLERRRAEEAQCQSEQHLTLALNAANVGTWEWRLDSGDIVHQAGLGQVLGQEGECSFRRRQDYLEFVHHEDRATLESVMTQAVQSRSSFRNDHRITGEGKPIRWIAMQGNVICDANGKPVRIAGTLMDVTKKVQANEQIRHKEALLAHMARLSTMGEMVAGIAHEVNQPLYSIVNFSSACNNLLDNANFDEIDKVKHWNSEISNAALRAAEIIKRLKTFSMRHEHERISVDINDLILESIELIRYELREKKIEIKTLLEENGPLVEVDQVEIEQVIVNLLRNAIEAVAGDELDRHLITVHSIVNDNERVEVIVCDNGVGLPSDQELRLFDAFITTKNDGMGMGLAISKKIITAHGGEINARPLAGSGAEFRFWLPQANSSDPKSISRHNTRDHARETEV